MKSVMLDLETMGTKPYSAIVAIGAVMFDMEGIHSEFYSTVSLSSCEALGMLMDADTALWWMRQAPEVRVALTGRKPLDETLTSFDFWFTGASCPDMELWGNGSDFDNVLLACAYERAGLKQPWKWNKNRCYRTIKNLSPSIKMERKGTHHNALDDARSQALHLIEIKMKGVSVEWPT